MGVNLAEREAPIEKGITSKGQTAHSGHQTEWQADRRAHQIGDRDPNQPGSGRTEEATIWDCFPDRGSSVDLEPLPDLTPEDEKEGQDVDKKRDECCRQN